MYQLGLLELEAVIHVITKKTKLIISGNDEVVNINTASIKANVIERIEEQIQAFERINAKARIVYYVE